MHTPYASSCYQQDFTMCGSRETSHAVQLVVTCILSKLSVMAGTTHPAVALLQASTFLTFNTAVPCLLAATAELCLQHRLTDTTQIGAAKAAAARQQPAMTVGHCILLQNEADA